MNLLIDNLRIIYNFLPIPDKRNFIRINKKCNTLAYLISNSKNEFRKNMAIYQIFKEYKFDMKNLTKLEELTMESLYYGYISMMPRSYINNNNRLLKESYLYFHTGVIGNKEIIHMLTSISKINICDITEGLAFSGHTKLLKIYINMIVSMDKDKDKDKDNIITAASAGRQIKILKWLSRKYGLESNSNSVSAAFNNNHMDVFIFLIKKIGAYEGKYYMEFICNGYMDVIIRIHNQGYDMPDACQIAVESNQLEILKWLRGKNYLWDDRLCYTAAMYRHFDILKWLHENDCILDKYTANEVAISGNLEMLKWLEESGCPFGENILVEASASGNLEMLKYLYNKGFEISRTCYFYAVNYNNLKTIEWIYKHISLNYKNKPDICRRASYTGNYDSLKWFVTHNFSCDEHVAQNIFRHGDFEMLDWIFENKLIISAEACNYIAWHGRLDVLKKVKEYGCEWNYKVCKVAMQNGYVDIVRWAHNNGCEWRDCKCYKKNKGTCEFTEKSIEKWVNQEYNKEFNFMIIQSRKYF